MPFTVEDKVIIENYRLDKEYGGKLLQKEFPEEL